MVWCTSLSKPEKAPVALEGTASLVLSSNVDDLHSSVQHGYIILCFSFSMPAAVGLTSVA